MHRILIVSDTHGQISDVIRLISNIEEIDEVWHLGDTVEDALELSRAFPDISFKYVRGNNDWSIRTPSEKIIELFGHRIFICHGHGYSISRGCDGLSLAALDNGCDIALYGHTHIAKDEEQNGVRCFCPGSAAYPRDNERCVGIIEADESYFGLCHYKF